MAGETLFIAANISDNAAVLETQLLGEHVQLRVLLSTHTGGEAEVDAMRLQLRPREGIVAEIVGMP